MNEIFFLTLFLLISTFTNADDSNIWNLEIKQEQVLTRVTYHGRALDVWKQDVQGQKYSRFYVTPLCVLDLKKLSCDSDEYSTGHPWIFNFYVKLWDDEVAKAVQKELNSKGFKADVSDIFFLPIQSVRTGIDQPSERIESEKRWKPNNQEWDTSFKLFPDSNETCQKMLLDASNNTQKFLMTLQLYFEFSMVASQLSSRNISISGQFLQNSKMFNTMTNKNADDEGVVYLSSTDVNKLAHDIVNEATYREEVSSDYVPAENEDAVIEALLKQFQKDKVTSDSLSKEKWGSVFWSDIFTRPDIQTAYFNNVLKIDENGKDFKYDKEAEKAFQEKTANEHTESKTIGGGGGFSIAGFGLSAEASVTNAHGDAVSNEHGNKTRDVLKFEDVQNSLKKDNVNVKWNGKKFEQKNLDLYRINTRELSSQSSICFLRTTVTKQAATQKIYIKAELNVPKTPMHQPTLQPTLPPTLKFTIARMPFVLFSEFAYLPSQPVGLLRKSKKQFLTSDCSSIKLHHARSVHTMGQCVKVFSNLFCSGESRIFSNDSRNNCDNRDFEKCGFKDRAVSYVKC